MFLARYLKTLKIIKTGLILKFGKKVGAYYFQNHLIFKSRLIYNPNKKAVISDKSIITAYYQNNKL